jgi:hypothetical protein
VFAYLARAARASLTIHGTPDGIAFVADNKGVPNSLVGLDGLDGWHSWGYFVSSSLASLQMVSAFNFLFWIWAAKNGSLSPRSNKKSGFPLFFIFYF